MIGKQAYELRQQGLSWVKIAKKLRVSDKTAKKAAASFPGAGFSVWLMPGSTEPFRALSQMPHQV
jgi:hypothetical protein